MAHKHDRRYKKFFKNPAFVRKLLESFVKESFVDDLDYSTLKNANKEFINEDHGKRESDLIYSIEFKDSMIYIFIMIEFQSKPDNKMPIRLLLLCHRTV